MSDILDEVEREAREEKSYKTFMALFPYIVSVSLLIIIVTAMFSWFNYRKEQKLEEMGDILFGALGKEDGDLVKESLDFIANSTDYKIKEIAAINLALKDLERNNFGQALKSFAKILEDDKFSEVTRNHAKLMWLYIALLDKTKNVDHDVLNKSLDSFHDEKQPFFGLGNLFKSLWFIKQGKKDDAVINLHKIMESDAVSRVTKEQASILLNNLEQI